MISKKYIIISIITILTLCFSAYFFSNKKNDSTKSEKNITQEKLDETKKEENIVKKDSRKDLVVKDSNVLSQIETELNKEKEIKSKELIDAENKIRDVVENYMLDINNDLNIVKYLNFDSVRTIKKNTGIVYNKLTDSEKLDFISELNSYWYPNDSFDPDNSSDINDYINFIIKSWIKQNWKIKEYEHVRFDINTANEEYSTDINIKYNNWTEKDIKLFFDSKYKINISI